MFTQTEQSIWNEYALLREGVTYQVPDMPKTLMSDFYVMAYLDTIPYQKLAAAGNTNALRYEDDLQEDLKYARGVLYPFLKKHMLNGVFFAISAEFRHLFDVTVDTAYMKKYEPFIRAYHKYYRHYKHPVGKRDPRKPNTTDFGRDDPGYQASYAAIVKAQQQVGWGPVKTADCIMDGFLESNWNGSYGGRAWAEIARSWIQLHETKDTDHNKLAVIIDHVYDLQHNTNTVFNKLRSYYDDKAGYQWLVQMLDFKANLKNIHDLLPTCSSLMVKLARPLLKAANIKPSPNTTAKKLAQARVAVSAIPKVDPSAGYPPDKVIIDSPGNTEKLYAKLCKLIEDQSDQLVELLLDDQAASSPTSIKPVAIFIANGFKASSSDEFSSIIIDALSDMLTSSDKAELGKMFDGIDADFLFVDDNNWNSTHWNKSYDKFSFVQPVTNWRIILGSLFWPNSPVYQRTINSVNAGIVPHLARLSKIQEFSNIIPPTHPIYKWKENDVIRGVEIIVENFVTDLIKVSILGNSNPDLPYAQALVGFADSYPNITWDHELIDPIFNDIANSMAQNEKTEEHFKFNDFTKYVPGMKNQPYTSYTSKQWLALLNSISLDTISKVIAYVVNHYKTVIQKLLEIHAGDIEGTDDDDDKSPPQKKTHNYKDEKLSDVAIGVMKALTTETHSLIGEALFLHNLTDTESKDIAKTAASYLQLYPGTDLLNHGFGQILMEKIADRIVTNANYTDYLFASDTDFSKWLPTGKIPMVTEKKWLYIIEHVIKVHISDMSNAVYNAIRKHQSEILEYLDSGDKATSQKGLILHGVHGLLADVAAMFAVGMINGPASHIDKAIYESLKSFINLPTSWNPNTDDTFMQYCRWEVLNQLLQNKEVAKGIFNRCDNFESFVPDMKGKKYAYTEEEWGELLAMVRVFNEREWANAVKRGVKPYTSELKKMYDDENKI